MSHFANADGLSNYNSLFHRNIRQIISIQIQETRIKHLLRCPANIALPTTANTWRDKHLGVCDLRIVLVTIEDNTPILCVLCLCVVCATDLVDMVQIGLVA